MGRRAGAGGPHKSLVALPGAFPPPPPGSPSPRRGPTLRPSSRRRRPQLPLIPGSSFLCAAAPVPRSPPPLFLLGAALLLSLRPPLPPLPRFSRRLGAGPGPPLPPRRCPPPRPPVLRGPRRREGRLMVCPPLRMAGLEIAPLPRASPPPRCSSFP